MFLENGQFFTQYEHRNAQYEHRHGDNGQPCLIPLELVNYAQD